MSGRRKARWRRRRLGERGWPLLAPLLVVAALYLERPAHAEAPSPAGAHFSLSWARTNGGEGCISAPEIARAVEARLGRRVFVPSTETEVAIEGYVGKSAADGTFRAVLAITNANGARSGVRELVGSTSNCRDLDASLVLTMALLIDPDAAPDEQDEDPFDERRQRHAPHTARRAPEPTDGATIRRFALSVGPGVAFGLLPRPAVGAWGRAEWQPRRFWPIDLGASYWFEQTRSIDERTQVAFSAFKIDATTCPLSSHSGLFGYALCGGVDTGLLDANGTGRDGLIVHHRLVVDAIGRASVVVSPAEAFSVTLGGLLAASLHRDTFVYRTDTDALRPLFEVPVVTGALEIGLIFRLP